MTIIRMPVVTLDAAGRPVVLGSCDMLQPDEVTCYIQVAEPMRDLAPYLGEQAMPATQTIRHGTFKIIMTTLPPMRAQVPAVLAARDSEALAWLPGWKPA